MNRESGRIDVGLLWHSLTSGNLGVGALTLAHIEILRSAARSVGLRPVFRVLSWAEDRAAYAVGDDVVVDPFRLADFARPVGGFLSRVKACDVVFDIGAGDSFSDIYGPSRILKMMAAQGLVRLAGRTHVFSPQTIGPFENAMIARMASSMLGSASFVAVRDPLSADCARALGCSRPLVEATDVALRLPYERQARRNDGRIQVGMNVSGLLFNGGYSRNNMFGLAADYAEVTRAVLRRFLAEPQVELHLVGHVLTPETPVEDDRAAALALAEEFPGVVVAPAFADPSAAKTYIAAMDFFIGARMHACVAALSGGVPVVPLAYSRKFSGLFGGLGYEHGVDLRTASLEEAVEKVARAFARRELLRADAACALETGLKRLEGYEAAAADLLSSCAERRSCAA